MHEARDCALWPGQATRDIWCRNQVAIVQRRHMTTRYAEIHPNMVVPALVHDGELWLESLDIIRYIDDVFGGAPLVPRESGLLAATMARVEEAKVLHRSIRYVTFHWGLGRLAMLNPKEREQLATLARHGKDGEHLVEFYDGYSTGSIPESVYTDHLRKLHTPFTELDDELGDGRCFLMSDEVSIADAFWAMKILRLTECGYPVASHHPRLNDWYQRIYQRPSFQNEVMQKNRLTNRAFRAKARVESLLGIGLERAVDELAA